MSVQLNSFRACQIVALKKAAISDQKNADDLCFQAKPKTQSVNQYIIVITEISVIRREKQPVNHQNYPRKQKKKCERCIERSQDKKIRVADICFSTNYPFLEQQ